MQARLQPGATRVAVLVLAAAVAAALGAPAPAEACGGLVCDGGGPAGGPVVSQANERILFAVLDDGAGGTTMTTVIQIQYTGAPDDFAWILPVLEVPESIDVASVDFFDQLDAFTAPSFQFAPSGGGFGGGGRRGCGFGLGFACSASPSGSDGGAVGADAGGNVNVWGTGVVGPFELAIISSDSVDPLLEWIYRHGFQAPPAFVTIADDYVKENFKFVVLRLVPEAGVTALAPLVLVTRESYPCVPLRMTSVAAQPDMGIRIWVAGPSRAVPLNYGAATPDYGSLLSTGLSGYESLIRDAVDAEGGKAWVTEHAEPLPGALVDPTFGIAVSSREVLAILGDAAYLTRLYTKMSDYEMDEDPFLVFEPGGADVGNSITVSSNGVTAASVGSESGAFLLAGEAVLAAAIGALALSRRLLRRRRPGLD